MKPAAILDTRPVFVPAYHTDAKSEDCPKNSDQNRDKERNAKPGEYQLPPVFADKGLLEAFGNGIPPRGFLRRRSGIH